MNICRLSFLCLGLSMVALSGCDSGEAWRSGPYSIYWFDSSANLELGLDLENGSIIGRIGPSIFAVGENTEWIVAGRHPNGDKDKEQFFYFSKAEDSTHKNANEVVKGPFTRTQFEQLRQKLDLPGWTKEFSP